MLALAVASWPRNASAKAATASASLSGLDLTSTTHYALGYICTWTGSAWKCGCRDTACVQSYWQIQKFQR
jgi:hypothetical protein